MSTTPKLAFLFAAACIVAAGLAAQTAGGPTDAQRAIQNAKRILESLREMQGIPGLSVAVGLGGRIVFSEGFGEADLEHRVAVGVETRFRIGSVSKALTAAGMAVLVERGELDLDRSIRDYVPSFPDQGHEITARRLAGHLGGIRHYRPAGFFNRDEFETVEESLGVFMNDRLMHEPGSKYLYSSYGYVLLSAVMEGAAGRPYLEFMREEVFGPLVMGHTVPDRTDAIVVGRAEFYERRDGVIVNAPSENYSYKWAGGGWLSTAEDLVGFGMKLMAGDLVETLTLLFESQKTSSGEETGYGMGWRPDRDHRDRRVVHHGGSSEGARAFFLLYPDEGLAIALLANLSNASILEGEAESLAQLFLPGETMGSPAPDGLEGRYRFSATADGVEVEGELSLTRSEGRYEGRLSRFYSDDAPVVHVSSNGERVRLVVSTRSGLPNLWLRFGDDGFQGQWGWERPRWPFNGTKIIN